MIACAFPGPASVRADFSEDLYQASRPLQEGVPDVAVTRLKKLSGKILLQPRRGRSLKNWLSRSLPAGGRTRPFGCFKTGGRTDLRRRSFGRPRPWRPSGRWSEALALYQAVAAGESPLSAGSAFLVAAEALRALGRSREALHELNALLNDKEWKFAGASSVGRIVFGQIGPGQCAPDA